jgi:hypothetical protein
VWSAKGRGRGNKPQSESIERMNRKTAVFKVAQEGKNCEKTVLSSPLLIRREKQEYSPYF